MGVAGSPPPNVLLVVLDTVTARHTSLHGYPRETTPGLERLAEG
jgi:glucan phosphoethanolaminetransferase (alkaline phosphatase superfamily)